MEKWKAERTTTRAAFFSKWGGADKVTLEMKNEVQDAMRVEVARLHAIYPEVTKDDIRNHLLVAVRPVFYGKRDKAAPVTRRKSIFPSSPIVADRESLAAQLRAARESLQTLDLEIRYYLARAEQAKADRAAFAAEMQELPNMVFLPEEIPALV